jgi:hypothetical protein
MANYVVTLGTAGAGGGGPRYEVDAQSDRHASALAIRHFMRTGHAVPQTATLDLEAENQGPQTLSVESVLRWLRSDAEGQSFARAEGLDLLADARTPS